MKTIKNILVPTDLSNLSLVAMDYAISLAMMYKAKIYMLHVIDHDPVLAFPTVDRHFQTVPRDARKRARKSLKHWISDRWKSGGAITEVVRRGDPSKEIVGFAREKGIELIVMATHGRSGIAHFIMGSVAEKVVRYAPVPVLTIKPKEMQRRFSDENISTTTKCAKD